MSDFRSPVLHAVYPFLFAVLLMLLVALAPRPATAEKQAPPRRPLLPIYNGLPPTPVSSTSEVRGARGVVEIGPVLQGDLLQHTIEIHNDSAAPWRLEDLTLCRGCMLDGASQAIAPGDVGHISFVVPTDALGGQTIESPIHAETGIDAPARIEITVRLQVEEFVALDPYRLWLKGAVGEPVEATVLVVPNDAYPFSIREIKTRKGVWFEHQLREIEHEGRKAYAIDVRNTRTKPGPYQDVLFVQTDHPQRPEFKIRIEGRIE